MRLLPKIIGVLLGASIFFAVGVGLANAHGSTSRASQCSRHSPGAAR